MSSRWPNAVQSAIQELTGAARQRRELSGDEQLDAALIVTVAGIVSPVFDGPNAHRYNPSWQRSIEKAIQEISDAPRPGGDDNAHNVVVQDSGSEVAAAMLSTLDSTSELGHIASLEAIGVGVVAACSVPQPMAAAIAVAGAQTETDKMEQALATPSSPKQRHPGVPARPPTRRDKHLPAHGVGLAVTAMPAEVPSVTDVSDSQRPTGLSLERSLDGLKVSMTAAVTTSAPDTASVAGPGVTSSRLYPALPTPSGSPAASDDDVAHMPSTKHSRAPTTMEPTAMAASPALDTPVATSQAPVSVQTDGGAPNDSTASGSTVTSSPARAGEPTLGLSQQAALAVARASGPRPLRRIPATKTTKVLTVQDHGHPT